MSQHFLSKPFPRFSLAPLEYAAKLKVLVTAAFPAFVEMANLQADDCVLDVKCGDGELVAEILTVAGGPPVSVIGFSDDEAGYHSAKRLIKSKNLKKQCSLYIYRIFSAHYPILIEYLGERHRPFKFHKIFAVDALPQSLFERVAALRFLAGCLEPKVGRMIVTFRHADGYLGVIAGAVRFDKEGRVYHRTSWMLESEWDRAETEVHDLAAQAGLRVTEMRRVGFHGAEAQLWVDDSARLDTLARQSLVPSGTDSQGNPTVAFKNARKLEVTQSYNYPFVLEEDSLIGTRPEEDILVGACLVAVLAVL